MSTDPSSSTAGETAAKPGPLTLKSHVSKTLDRPPSCVQCMSPDREYFVVGTYELDATETQNEVEKTDQPQSRSGSLILFYMGSDNNLITIDTVQTPGAVTDMRFSEELTQGVLIVALSTGKISLFQFHGDRRFGDWRPENAKLAHLKTVALFPPSILILSIALHPTIRGKLAVTTSAGNVHELEVIDQETSSGKLDVVNSGVLLHHDEQAWTAAFAQTNTEGVQSALASKTKQGGERERLYSGGDDGILRSTSFVVHNNKLRDFQPGRTLQKPFGAGVTAILPLPAASQFPAADGLSSLLLVGSYDDRIRLIDPMASSVLAEENLEGGVWQLSQVDSFSKYESWTITPDGHEKTEPAEENYLILASCCFAGARILRVHGRNKIWTINVLAKFVEHESMCYASAVRPWASLGLDFSGRTEGWPYIKSRLTHHFVSTSYYDRLLCMWDYEDKDDKLRA
ncbi:MAG: hypothetical protein M4579_003022 [Chaenotheca gracillima]|nr:MAG: hypothetical protein M4579_003022 [Chaenotheca gracillima]